MALQKLRLGLDENGLGPRLGFMTVTAVALSTPAEDGVFSRAAAEAGIDDSKKLCAHGDMSTVESLVLSLLDVHLGGTVTDLDGLITAIGMHNRDWLRAPCPPGEAPVACHGSSVLLPAFGLGITAESTATAQNLARLGVHLRAVRTTLVCPGRLNAERQRGRSRFDVDLDAMIDLYTRLQRELGGATVSITCGKVGGRKRYAAALARTSPLVSVLEETARQSMYGVPGVGTVGFVMDADATHPEVSLASLFGKYLRELTVERTYRYYTQEIQGLSRVSGYHDPTTARFVAATRLLRLARAIPDPCFER